MKFCMCVFVGGREREREKERNKVYYGCEK